MGHLLRHASTDYAPTRASPGGSILLYFNQGGRVLERSLFLESRSSNGAIAKDGCKYLNYGGDLLFPKSPPMAFSFKAEHNM
jgi:hypothetical protein